MNDQPDDRFRVGMIESGHRLAPTLTKLRELGVPDHQVDIASVHAVAASLSARCYDLVHVCTPDPSSTPILRIARAVGVPVGTGYDPELGGDDSEPVIAAFYRQADVVFSPSRAADRLLGRLGVRGERIWRWAPGVDFDCFHPARFAPEVLGDHGARGRINVLCAGLDATDPGLALLVNAFLLAHDREPRLHLVLACDEVALGPLRRLLGAAATVLGELEPERLAQVYATADLFVWPSAGDPSATAVSEAQASGLPVFAVGEGAGAELIQNGRSGCLVTPSAPALGDAIRGLARRATLLDRLATGGLRAVRERTWERSLAQLSAGWMSARTSSEVAHAA